MKYEIVSVSKLFKKHNKMYFVMGTQDYNAEYDMGHYRFFVSLLPSGYPIEIENGNILKVGQSMGAPPMGKIDAQWSKETFNDFYMEDMKFRKREEKRRQLH